LICRGNPLHTSTNTAKNLTQREKRLREKKTKIVPNQNSIGSASRRESTERRKTKKKSVLCFYADCGYFTQREEKIRIWKISEIKFIRNCLKKYFHREKKD
jgi:hypothetical protein